LDHALTILPDQAIEIVGIEKQVMVGRTMRSAYWLNHDPSWDGLGGLRSGDQVTAFQLCNGVTVPETAFLKRRYGFVTV
jgi:hypothetical protein